MIAYPCMFCGYDIVHKGRPARACWWDWNVRWAYMWYRIGQLHTLQYGY